MALRLLSIPDFYAAEARFWERVDPAAVGDEPAALAAELDAQAAALRAVLGDPAGRSVLDASCGTGAQALALARAGWRVTAADVAEVPLEIARRRADRLGLALDFRRCDMRDLGRHDAGAFDCVLTCGALDNVTGRGGVPAALRGMRRALRPGGLWYAWLRDLEWVLAHESRYKCKGVRAVPHGRVVTVEDWLPAGPGHVVHVYAHLHEDRRRTSPDEPWHTEAFGYRRRILRKAELAQALGSVGFEQIAFLPQAHPWNGYGVTARKPRA